MSQEEVPKDGNERKNGIPRRALIGAGLVAVAAGSGVVVNKLLEDTREEEFLAEIEKARNGIREGVQKLGGSEDEALRVIVENRVVPDWLKLQDTIFDLRRLEEKTILLTFSSEGELRVVSNFKNAQELVDLVTGQVGYAQGILFTLGSDRASGHFLVNDHFVNDFLQRNVAGVQVYRQYPNLDLAIIDIRNIDAQLSQLAPRLRPDMTNVDVHGEFVAFTAYDPDPTSLRMHGGSIIGRKAIGGIAVQTPPAIANAGRIEGRTDEESRKILQMSFMVEVPEVQGDKWFYDPGSRRYAPPLAGMSGSPVYVFRNNTYELCGIMLAVDRFRDHRGTYRSFAFFAGPEMIRQIFPPRVPPLDTK
jgi:hypothetical protein